VSLRLELKVEAKRDSIFSVKGMHRGTSGEIARSFRHAQMGDGLFLTFSYVHRHGPGYSELVSMYTSSDLGM